MPSAANRIWRISTSSHFRETPGLRATNSQEHHFTDAHTMRICGRAAGGTCQHPPDFQRSERAFHGRVDQGRSDPRGKSVAESKSSDPGSHLLLYIAATQQNRQDVAEPHLASAITLMSAGDQENRAFAKALDGKADRPLADLLKLRERPSDKAVVLVALGLKNEAWRKDCFELAQS